MTPAQLGIHGTVSMFLKGKCSCEPCKEAVATRIKHGTVGSYRKYRCRCDLCRAASNAAQRASRGDTPQVTKWVPKEQPDAYAVDTSDAEVEFATVLQLRTIDQWSHGDYRRAKAGCRCPLCEAGKARWYAEYLRDIRPEQHGALTAYNAGCRCKLCCDHKRLVSATAAIKRQRAATHT